MKFTEEQIQRLYRFTREHFVEHYDVQSELVDHLANSIEQVLDEKPRLTFEEALNISFKKFGVFGFMDIVGAKTKAMGKNYQKLVLKLLRDFFTIPRILVSFTLFLAILVSYSIFSTEYVSMAIAVLGILVLSVKMIQIKKLQKKRFKESGKKWLLEEIVLNMGNLAVVMNLFFQIALRAPSNASTIFEIISAGFWTVFILLIYITTFVLPDQIEAILENQYPEYKLV